MAPKFFFAEINRIDDEKKIMAVIYIDEEAGSDLPEVQGTESAPYKTIFEAFFRHGAESEYQVKKKDDEEYKPAAKSALKKATSYAAQQKKKLEAAAKRAEKEAQEEAAREAVLEEAKKIKIVNDPSLPEPVRINLGETDAAVVGVLRKSKDEPAEGVKRVSVQGRVQRVAKQGGLIFVTLRRGLHQMQCLLSGDLSKTYDALTLMRETSMEIVGELWEVPAGAHAPLDRELRADYFKIIARAPGGDDAFTNQVPLDGDTQTLLNMRHLTLRHEKPAAIMFVRDVVESAFQTAYRELDVKKVNPPALVQTQVEGGATLFKFDYYGETSYLTQSSQLYLETVLPVLGDVYCIEKSFRAEKSLTRRHVSAVHSAANQIDRLDADHGSFPSTPTSRPSWTLSHSMTSWATSSMSSAGLSTWLWRTPMRPRPSRSTTPSSRSLSDHSCECATRTPSTGSENGASRTRRATTTPLVMTCMCISRVLDVSHFANGYKAPRLLSAR